MKRSTRLIVDFAAMVDASGDLTSQDRHWCGRGYCRAGCRIWRRADGRYTARLVWRNRDEGITVTYVMRGLALPASVLR